MWYAANGKQLKYHKEPKEISFFTSEHSKNLNALACAGQEQTVRIYDVETLKVTNKFQGEVIGHKNRIFALKFDPMNPYVLYSGAWDCYILVNDLRMREKVGDILGPYICGECLDISKDGKYLIAGSYTSSSYLSLYDTSTFTKLQDIQWMSNDGLQGFVYAAKFWTGKQTYPLKIVAGSS